MNPVKRAFPVLVWLAGFLLALASILSGLWLLRNAAVEAVSIPDFSTLLQPGSFLLLLPELETALYATLLCLFVGYPSGCLLAAFKHRTAFISVVMPLFSLGGTLILLSEKLIPLVPDAFVPALIFLDAMQLPRYLVISLSLLPLMILCACSFTAAVDPALARAARCLGASRFRAYLTLSFPRVLKGVPAGAVMVFLPALGLSLLTGPEAGSAFDFAVPFLSVLMFLTLAALLVCLLVLNKTRRLSPC